MTTRAGFNANALGVEVFKTMNAVCIAHVAVLAVAGGNGLGVF